MASVSIPGRMDAIRAFKEAGGRVAAVFPIHYPRALLRAHGYLPVEVWGPPGADRSAGEAHVQAYVCSIVRNGLAFQLSGGLDAVDALVVPHACDSLQGLGSLLLDFERPDKPVWPFYLPRGQRVSDVAYLADELRALSRRVGEASGTAPTDAELHAAIAREEAADGLLARLHAERDWLALDDAALYTVIRAREHLPAERFVEVADAALARRAEAPPKGVPIVLSGIVPEPKAVLPLLTEAGARVVADDFAACGRRLYGAVEADDPFERMARRIQEGPPCSTRGNPITQRVAWLKQLCEQRGGRGVVFLVVKFCEPELFDLPQVRQGLDAAGVPSVTLEVDIGDALPHQVATRLEAFVEMLS